MSNEMANLSDFPILKEMGLLERGDRIDDQPSTRRFMADGQDTILLSFRQNLFINSILQANNLRLACQASGIEAATAELWFANEKFRAYFTEIENQKILADEVTKTSVKARIREIITGQGRKPGRVEGRIIEVLFKDLCSTGPFGNVDESAGWVFTAQKKPNPIQGDIVDADPA